MEDPENMESEWRKYAPPDAELIDLHIAQDLRHIGIYLLSILTTVIWAAQNLRLIGPSPLPSSCSTLQRGLLGADNMFRPIAARHAYGILPAWNFTDQGPVTTDQLFAEVSFRPAIQLDLQGFPDDDAAALCVAFRVWPTEPWAMYFRERFLEAGSEKALLQVLHIDAAVSSILNEAVTNLGEQDSQDVEVFERHRQWKETLRRLVVSARETHEVDTAPPAGAHETEGDT